MPDPTFRDSVRDGAPGAFDCDRRLCHFERAFPKPPDALMASANNILNGWLVGYSALLAPVAGVMIADYYLIAKLRARPLLFGKQGGGQRWS